MLPALCLAGNCMAFNAITKQCQCFRLTVFVVSVAVLPGACCLFHFGVSVSHYATKSGPSMLCKAMQFNFSQNLCGNLCIAKQCRSPFA